MATQCTIDNNIPGSKVVAQQLFLGSSISSFSYTMGWNGTASNLSVDLVDDTSTTRCIDTNGTVLSIFPPLTNDQEDHYYTCVGNNCYIDENGNAYNPNRAYDPEFAAVGLPQSSRRIVPGKVYHKLTASGLVSKYWIDYDPGFFGNQTEISERGVYTKGSQHRYNLINAPVYFRFGYLEVGGFVKDWTCNNRLSTKSYTVNIEGPENLLDDCKVIVSKYGGSIFAKFGANPYGGPTNYTGTAGTYVGDLDAGNLPNVFNVYGFLESYGFGTSNSNDNGIPLAYILDALSVLTASTISQSPAAVLFPGVVINSQDTLLGYQRAFSPFGRILCPAVLKEGLNLINDTTEKGKTTIFGEKGFGIVDGIVMNGVNRVPYLLDLSEIPRPPLDVRYQGSSDSGITTIKDIIAEACQKTGRDFYAVIIRKDGGNFIKIKTVDRTRRISGHAVESLISSLETSGLPVSSSSYGQVKNQAAQPRVLYAGANQQRLFQAKSYLLGYSNTHLIYHPVLKKFVDYFRFGSSQVLPNSDQYMTSGTRGKTWSPTQVNKWVDSVRIPMAYSTRNIAMCSTVNTPFIASIWGAEQIAAQATPLWGTDGGAIDPGFVDSPVGGSVNLYTGNYWLAEKGCTITPPSPSGTAELSCGQSSAVNSPSATRFIPLYHYAISPFFGYAHDQYVPINLAKGSNNYSFIRPVYLDTWTGALTIVFRPNEGPLLSLGNLPMVYQTRFPENGGTNPNSGGGIVSSSASSGVPVPSTKDTTKNVGPSGYVSASTTGVPAGTSGNAPTPPALTAPSRTQAYSGYSVSQIGFTVTETELRAACAGLDNYLCYCLQKSSFSKPDLFSQLVAVYRDKGKLFVSTNDNINNPNTGNGIGSMDHLSTSVRTSNMNGPAPGLKANTQNANNNPLSYNFDWALSSEFIKDLQIIVNFLKNLHDTHYGRTYMVRLPEVLAYQDKQYAPIMVGPLTSPVYAYKGSGKIFFNYEICNEGAWEEFGNYIDDCIMIGTPNYYKLSESNGLIKPIIGYNATPVRDYVSAAWCSLDINARIAAWSGVAADAHVAANDAKDFIAANSDTPIDVARGGTAYNIAVAKYKVAKKQLNRLGGALRDCSNLVVPVLDISTLDSSEFTVVAPGDFGRTDPYDNKSMGNNFILDNAAQIQSDQALAATSGNATTVPPLSLQSQLNTSVMHGPTKTYKLYIKSECAENFVFLDPIRLLGPRAIISSPGINLYNSSMSYTQDPNNTVLSNASAEDYGILNAMQKLANGSAKSVNQFNSFLKKITAGFSFINNNTIEDGATIDEDCTKLINNIYAILLGNMVSIYDNNYLLPQRSSTNNVTKTHLSICPKKANPMFAAIPLKNNTACYGPWTNYPKLVTDDRVFPSGTTIDDTRKKNIRENLIFKTDVKINNGWAPWEYGGMAFLDREILNEIDMNATYQSVIEEATLTMLGMPAFSLSGGLRIRLTESAVHTPVVYNFGGWNYHQLNALQPNYNGLVLSRISTSVSDRNILTTYNFETYKQRLGIYGKEISDMNKRFATTRIYLLNQMAEVNKKINNKFLLDADSIIRLNRTNEPKSGGPLKSLLWGNSPTELLVGSAHYYVPSIGLPKSSLDPGLNNTSYSTLANGVTTKLGLSKYLHNAVRTKNFVGNFTTIEALTELTKQFSSKSVMSLDGIFSPVSFYPTDNLGTYAISSRCSPAGSGIPGRRSNTICPMCNNTGKYNYTQGGSATEIACLLCAKSRVAFPSGDYEDQYDAPAINLVSLQPIVVPYGDFKNPNSQISTTGLERNRHNISVVGRQDSQQVGAQAFDFNNNLTTVFDSSNLSNIENKGGGSGELINGVNADYYDVDLSSNINMLSNNRFFAFRGPMMLHGWGYDINGYPIPNQADEPILDDLGRPKRFVLTSSGTNDLTKAGKFIPGTNELLGDVIGKGYTQEAGEWTKKPTRFFHLNWAERSDLWPIGPIDLRWDDDRKVWTSPKGCEELYPPYVVSSGTDIAALANFLKKRKNTNKCPYKMINVTLEEDMTLINNFNETFPARAFIDDAEYSSEMLPLNTRRLVYVRDKASYTAPRGAKLLCRYDRDTGFYEPVTKQAFIVFGTRTTGNNAVVDLKYIQGLKSGENAQRITITFDNSRFNFNLASNNRKGMFLYENGQWILIGSN